MKRNLFYLVAILSIIVCASCKSVSQVADKDDVPYIVAKNYFVRNDVTHNEPRKIENRKDFENTFGMAATMGKGGQPTEINFARQYVIAVMTAPTDHDTEIIPVSLKRNATSKDVTFSYSIRRGSKARSYKTHPCLIIVVDNNYDGKLHFSIMPHVRQ